MLHAGVNENELVSGSLRVEWEVLVLQCLAVQADEASLLSEHGCELVHDAAVHTAVVMLGGLSDLGKFELVGHIVEEIVQSICECALKGCR